MMLQCGEDYREVKGGRIGLHRIIKDKIVYIAD
jgi:hypothetical protein